MTDFINRLRRLAEALYRRLIALLPNPSHADLEYLLESVTSHGVPAALGFDQENFRQEVLSFVDSMKIRAFEYRYAPSIAEPTLYASVYACLIKAIFGDLQILTAEERREWADYFDGFQSTQDGLFRDPVLASERYEDSDWWGARHLVPHIMAAYVALGHLPKHRFAYLDDYKNINKLRDWLDAQSWTSTFSHRDDIDNKLMNIVCALQFERDHRNDAAAGNAVAFVQNYLVQRRNPETGLWGKLDVTNPEELSRSVQFAYHLYLCYFYDDLYPNCIAELTDAILATQNCYGGYGTSRHSSACEDIDSIDILMRLSHKSKWRHPAIDMSFKRSLVWIMANQNNDGGFVFRRNEPFTYGHKFMSSSKNESAMFPTWFRTLAISYATTSLGIANYNFVSCPGYQFQSSDTRSNPVN